MDTPFEEPKEDEWEGVPVKPRKEGREPWSERERADSAEKGLSDLAELKCSYKLDRIDRPRRSSNLLKFSHLITIKMSDKSNKLEQSSASMSPCFAPVTTQLLATKLLLRTSFAGSTVFYFVYANRPQNLVVKDVYHHCIAFACLTFLRISLPCCPSIS